MLTGILSVSNITKIEKHEMKVNGTNIKNYASMSNEHAKIEVDSKGIEVPVPLGYVGSKATGENLVDTGYVIYEGEEEVNDVNVAEAQKTRNQYVWIPVPDASKLYGTDINGKMWGKDVYNRKASDHSVNWTETDGIMSIKYLDDNREPDTSDYDSILKRIKIGPQTTHEFLMKLELEFNEMIDSIKKYGGFYIGRYETGSLTTNAPVIRKGNINLHGQTWYNMYSKCKTLKGENQHVETEMLWGCQFDRILVWLIETRNKKETEITTNSASWGNYKCSSIKYVDNNGVEQTIPVGTATMIPTGNSEQTKTNNIYDLAGNVYEYTKEASSDMNRVAKGGSYESAFYSMPNGGGTMKDYFMANYNTELAADGKYRGVGVRVSLYIK